MKPDPAPSDSAVAASMIRRRGLMLVLSSPSGAGKTTIARALLARDAGLVMSVSATTRPPRPGEINGIDYHFVDRAGFEAMVRRHEMLEHAEVFGNCYGTPRAPVESALAAGKDALFDIDWQGTQQLRQDARADLASIFILPPSVAELERRLKRRGQDSVEVVRRRMAKAGDEMSHWPEYDYIVINDLLENSVTAIESIIAAERLKRERQLGLADFVNSLRSIG
jgi:guanylate kinase